MAGVAVCGYFMITSSSMNERAFAFTGSVICWQAYYLVMIFEADMIRSTSKKKCAFCSQRLAEEQTSANRAPAAPGKPGKMLDGDPNREFALYCLK